MSESMVGQHIRDVLADAVGRAAESDERVTFTFNDQEYEVLPGDTYDAARIRAEKVLGGPIRSAEDEAAYWKAESERRDRETREAIENAGAATEAEMRAAEIPRLGSVEELVAYIDSLVQRPHDYGTCVYAMSHAAVAAFNFVARELGVTGFQASCADLDILRHTRRFNAGRLIDYENLLYPQYRDSIPGFDQYVEEQAEWLAVEAEKKLAGATGPESPAVTAWWQQLAAALPDR